MWQDVQPCPAVYSSSLLLNTNECHNVSFQLIISNGRFALAVRGGRGESGLSRDVSSCRPCRCSPGWRCAGIFTVPSVQTCTGWMTWRDHNITSTARLLLSLGRDSYIALSDIICWAFLQVLFCNKLGDLHLHSSEKEDIKINCDSSASHSA